MIIAVNNRFTGSGKAEGHEHIMLVTLRTIAQKYPQHSFLLIFDRDPGLLDLPANVKAIVSGPVTSNGIRLRYWLDYKLPALLKKHKPDILLNLDGTCSLRTKKPQYMLLNESGFLDHPAEMKRSLVKFYKKNMPAFLAKAAGIGTGSVYIQQLLIEKYKLSERSVELIRPGVDTLFSPLDWEAQEKIKEEFTAGRSYFLYSGAINDNSNLINLLKAFTFFKKRQKSSMLLVIAGKADESFKKEFRTYRLRDEVKLMEDLSAQELANITAAAYALVYPVHYADIPTTPLQSMRSAVPVVMSNVPALFAQFGEAALYVDPSDHKDIAEKMMLIYKDEDKAKALAKAGTLLADQYQPGPAAELLMESLSKVFNG